MLIPSYKLSADNIFNFRQREWNTSEIISTINEMLKCAEEYNILVKNVSFEDKKKNEISEMKKTISKLLKITLNVGTNNDKTIELKYEIPWLINNYFYVGGNRKIPIFQLFDKPLIARNNMIKLRTNIQTIQLVKTNNPKEGYYWNALIFNKKIPFSNLIVAMHGEKKVVKDFLKKTKKKVTLNYDCLLSDIEHIFEDPTIKIDKLLSPYFRGRSDKEIIENVKLLTNIDIFSNKYMETDNVVDELVWGIKNLGSDDVEMQKKFDDCSLDNKRLRFLEYFLYSFLCKDFYNMIISLKRSKKDTFSNNSKVVLMNANTSPIIQYESPINPLDEISRLTRIAMTGPGGFKKDNIPSYLRDIHPSMPGKICPADTGDRENCGSLQYIVPNLELKKGGRLDCKPSQTIPSISISHVPFLEHDDPTRLQMASSQMKHSIMLKNFDLPLVQSGIEGMYTDYTSFIFRAKKDGKVIFKNKDIIIVQYINKKCDVFNIGYKKSRLSIVDFYKTYYVVGENFKQGDIISESNYLTDGRLTIGRNLRTSIMTWYGYNYEDGIIISDKVIPKFTSVHYLDLSFEVSPDKVLLNLNGDADNYNPIPKMGQKMKKGEIYASIKSVESKSEGNFDIIFDSPTEKICDENCIIVDVKVYCNKKNKLLPQYSDFIENIINKQTHEKQDLIHTLEKYLTEDELEKFLTDLEVDNTTKDEEKFKIKGETIDGLLVSITAIYERPIKIGDKIGNRHGNKGIISTIVPEKQMPMTPDGKHCEVIINPLGIISRMNVGQLFELHLSMAVNELKDNILEKYEKGIGRIKKENNSSPEEEVDELQSDIFQYVLGFINIIDRTENNNYLKQMKNLLDDITIIQLIEIIKNDKFYVIQPPFESVKEEDLVEALEYVGVKMEYPCFEPISKKKTKKDVAVGYMYFEKLNHIAKDKNAVRGIGPYASKTSQPLHGKSRKGGQRIGEMEVLALAAHDASINLNEVLTTKSDSIKKRDKYISDMIQNNDLLWNTDDDPVSQSLRLLQSSLKTLGLNYKINEEDDDDDY